VIHISRFQQTSGRRPAGVVDFFFIADLPINPVCAC
jgi:hypothetical protein